MLKSDTNFVHATVALLKFDMITILRPSNFFEMGFREIKNLNDITRGCDQVNFWMWTRVFLCFFFSSLDVLDIVTVGQSFHDSNRLFPKARYVLHVRQSYCYS